MSPNVNGLWPALEPLPPELMRETLTYETSDLLLVGHMTNIADLARLLVGGGAGVPLHGMVASVVLKTAGSLIRGA